jgi:5-formyltetrahydrofolate cyclo-ligase
MRQTRDQTPPHLRAEWSQRIKNWLFDLASFQQAHRIHLFLSFQSEVQTLLWLEDFFALRKKIVVPVMGDGEERLLLAEIQNPDSPMVPNRFGILEPPQGTFKSIPPESIEFFLLPGLAFDRRGGRLGYGRGHYDRLLEGLPSHIKKAGLAFGFQIASHIPQMPGDVLMDFVITENGCITCQKD